MIGLTSRCLPWIKTKSVTAVASHHSRRSDPKKKAKLLNNQVSSVFTKEDGSALHDLGPSSVPDMPTISTRQKGIRKLLLRLNLHKAKGSRWTAHPPTQRNGQWNHSCTCLPGLITARQNSNRLEYIRSYSHANFQEGRQKKTSQLPPSGFNISLLQRSWNTLQSMHSSIMRLFDQHNILSDMQHGFCKQRSCESQLILTIQNLAKGLDDNTQIDAVFSCFSKAFYQVPRQRLAINLHHNDIRGTILSWIE